ncbi:DNA-binding transcriptional regulator NtrC, partial [Dissostichus eleginoides]
MALLVSSLKRRTSPENENGGKKTSDGRDQGGRGHFTQLMGPTTPRNEHVFRPTFRVGGDSGPIPCTAAELHGLLLLENIKQQRWGIGAFRRVAPQPSKRKNEDRSCDFALLCWRVDTKRVVWNILARMITCTVARRINWKGVNGKRAFSKMAMKIVLFRAVRKCAITSAAMDADISQHTIRWFNLASDREGGRQERQERRRQSQDTLPRIRIASGMRVRTGSGTRRTILKQSWTSAGPYLPQIRFADPIQFRADVRLDNGPSPFGGSGPDRLLSAAQIRP